MTSTAQPEPLQASQSNSQNQFTIATRDKAVNHACSRSTDKKFYHHLAYGSKARPRKSARDSRGSPSPGAQLSIRFRPAAAACRLAYGSAKSIERFDLQKPIPSACGTPSPDTTLAHPVDNEPHGTRAGRMHAAVANDICFFGSPAFLCCLYFARLRGLQYGKVASITVTPSPVSVAYGQSDITLTATAVNSAMPP